MTSPSTDEFQAPGCAVPVSVVMPVRNEERALATALRSVLSQDSCDVEVLVVDGDSEDRTREIVTAMATDDPRVRLLHNPLRSIPHALNVGLAAAQGEFLARVDGHSQLDAGYLRRAVEHLRSDPGLGAVGGKRVATAQTPRGRAIALALSSPFGVGNSTNHYGTHETQTDHASFPVYRTELLRRVGGWDPGLPVNEDVDLDFRLIQQGATILYDPKMSFAWHTPETLSGLGHQYRRYGRGKAAMVRKNGPRSVRPRHLVAPALVLALAGAGVVALSGRPRVALAIAAPYIAALAATTLTVPRGTGPDDSIERAALPGAFAAMHLAWGLGFLEGLAGTKPALSSAN
jgi:succinoglycan biosynthesis protein ExoA